MSIFTAYRRRLITCEAQLNPSGDSTGCYTSIDLSADVAANQAKAVSVEITGMISFQQINNIHDVAIVGALYNSAAVNPATPRLSLTANLAPTLLPAVPSYPMGTDHVVTAFPAYCVGLAASPYAYSGDGFQGSTVTSNPVSLRPISLFFTNGTTVITTLSIDFLLVNMFSTSNGRVSLAAVVTYITGADDLAVGVSGIDTIPYCGISSYAGSSGNGNVNIDKVGNVSVSSALGGFLPVAVGQVGLTSGTHAGVTSSLPVNSASTLSVSLDAVTTENQVSVKSVSASSFPVNLAAVGGSAVSNPLHTVLDSGILTSLTNQAHVILDSGVLTNVTTPSHVILDSGALTSVSTPSHVVVDSMNGGITLGVNISNIAGNALSSVELPINIESVNGTAITGSDLPVTGAGGSALVNDPQHPLYVRGL
jgi:hypothetical protein